MKTCILLLSLICISAYASQSDVDALLARGASSFGKEYIGVREQLVSLKEPDHLLLLKAAQDMARPWGERLSARIALERSEKAPHIEALRKFKWEYHPDYDPNNEYNIMGALASVSKSATPELKKSGVQYYFLEYLWKDTDEGMVAPTDSRWHRLWPEMCGDVSKSIPVSNYYGRVLLDAYIRKPGAHGIPNLLIDARCGDAVPYILENFQQWYDSMDPPNPLPEFVEGRKTGSAFFFSRVVGIADSRHADLLEKFATSHRHVEKYRPQIEEAKRRPPPPALPEPGFVLPPPSEFVLRAIQQEADDYRGVPKRQRTPEHEYFNRTK